MPETPAVETPESSLEVSEEVSEPTETEPKVFDEKTVKALREENAARRIREREAEARAQAAEKKLEELERAQLSQQERLQLEFEEAKSELANLRSRSKETLLEAAVSRRVRDFELVDVDAALKLLDKSAVEYGDDGHPTNVEEVLSATLEKYPFLKSVASSTPKVPPVNPGSTNPSKTRKSSDLSHEAIKKMSHEERVSRMPEIQQWMASGYGKA